MLKYVFKRILTLIPILLIVSFMIFWLMSMTGDPARTMAGEFASEEDIELIREKMGLNENIFVRYAKYMWKYLQGDMGQTLSGRDVRSEFLTRYPNTLRLAFSAMIVSSMLAVPMGIIAALKQNTLVDTSLSAIALMGVSMPNFWLGLMMVVLFSVRLAWLPATGAETWKHLIMPAICLGVSNVGLMARMTRSSMVDVIRADYLRTARAKGCSEKTVILKHALKNGLLPIITTFGSQFSGLMAGASVTESIFAFPGLGEYVVSSIRGNEYIAATSVIIFMTIVTAAILLFVDILYAYADPRIKARYTKK